MKFVLALCLIAFVSFSGCESSTNGNGNANTPFGKAESLPFAAWESLAGVYRLQAFDGASVPQTGRMHEIRVETGRYTAADGSWIRLINFGLISQYSDAGSQRWNFGPMNRYGTSQLVRGDIGNTFIYDCANVLVSQGGQSYYVSLHLEAQVLGSPGQPGSMITVRYTVSIPALGETSTHSYVLTR